LRFQGLFAQFLIYKKYAKYVPQKNVRAAKNTIKNIAQPTSRKSLGCSLSLNIK